VVRNITFASEKVLLLFIPPDHLSFFGQRKTTSTRRKGEGRAGGT
jgi:hypothetical protein